MYVFPTSEKAKEIKAALKALGIECNVKCGVGSCKWHFTVYLTKKRWMANNAFSEVEKRAMIIYFNSINAVNIFAEKHSEADLASMYTSTEVMLTA